MGKSQTQPWVDNWHWNNFCRTPLWRGPTGPSRAEMSRIAIDRSGDERAEWVLKQDEMKLARERVARYNFEQAWPAYWDQYGNPDWREPLREVREEFRQLFKKFWMEEV